MAKSNGEEVISESPGLEFTIAPDELALFDEDFTAEEDGENLRIDEKRKNIIQHESTDKKSHEKDALLNVPTTTTSEISNVAHNKPSQKKSFVPIIFEPFKPTEKSENTSLSVSNCNCLNKESLHPPGEECETIQKTAPQQPISVASELQDKISSLLLPPGEPSGSKSSCLEKLKPICLVTPAATRKVEAPTVNNYVGPGAYQPLALNNFMQNYCGPTPMDYAAHFTPYGTFSEPCFFPQPPLYCPPPMYSEPMLMCAVPEPLPPPQPYNTGHYGSSAYSSMFTATPHLSSFVSTVNTDIMPPALPQHIVSVSPHQIPQPTVLPSCPPPVSMMNAVAPAVSMPTLSTGSLVAVRTNSLPYASAETAPPKYTVQGKEKESEESRFIVSFSNIYKFVHQAEFRKLVTVCGSLKYFKYQPPVIGGDAHGSAEAGFTNRQSALRAKRLLSALTIGGAQITTSSSTSLVDTIALSDPEKSKDVECMVAITNLLQSASRVFNWDNYQYWQKSSTLGLSIKPENRPFPESKPVLLKQKEERGCGRNNLITIRLGATKLSTSPPVIDNQMPPVSSIQSLPVSSIQMLPVTAVSTTNSCPTLNSIGAWHHSLKCLQSIDPPQPVPSPVLHPLNSSSCHLDKQSSPTNWPQQNTASKRSDDGNGSAGDKPSNKTILATIEAINKQISDRKERINKQLEKLYTETSRIRKCDEFCVRVDGLRKSAVEDLQRSCNAAQHYIGSEAIFLLGDSDRACLLQQLLHRHRLLDARVRAELLNCQALTANISTTVKLQYIRNVQQALTVHEEEARKTLIDDLDQVVDVYKYKMKKCSTPRCCDLGCLYFHNASDYRRDPLIFSYRAEFCLERPQCKESVRCGLCHTEAELQVHPEVYLSEVCQDWTDDETGCPHRPGDCFKAHPKSPEMVFHPEWSDLYVKGLRNTFLFLAGAVRNMHRVDTVTADKVRVLALFPCEALVESAMQLLAPTAQLHLVRIAAVTSKKAEPQEASVLLGTVSALVALMRQKGCAPFSDLRVLFVDDLPSIIEEPKMLDDFVCFVSLLYTTLAKTGRQQSLQRVVLAQEVNDEEVAAARTLLSTNFLLATRSYAPKEVHTPKPSCDKVPVPQPPEYHKNDHRDTMEPSMVEVTGRQYRTRDENSEGTSRQNHNRDENNGRASRQKGNKNAQDELEQPNQGENASHEENDMNKSSQRSNYDGSRKYGRRLEPKNVLQRNPKESLTDREREAERREKSMDVYQAKNVLQHNQNECPEAHEREGGSREKSIGVYRRHDEKDNYREATRRQERDCFRNTEQQADYNEISREKSHRQELRDRPRRDSRGSSAEKSTKHSRDDSRSRDDELRFEQEPSKSTLPGQSQLKYSSPEFYELDIPIGNVADEPPTNSGIKRKSEELNTEPKTWRIKLSSVTVNPAKKKKDETVRSVGASTDAAGQHSISGKSESDKTINEYLDEERKLRKDHEEEYEVFKDMPEMHPDYEEIMEEFTKLYPAGDEDRRWKMFWNIKLETIRENAWVEKKKDLIEKLKAATIQKNEPKSSADTKQSLFDKGDSQLVDSDKFSMTDAYDSLDDQTDEMGVLGPPLRRLLRQARSAGGNTVSAITLFTNPDNATLIRMCVDRLKKLLPIAPQSKVLVWRRTAALADCLLTHAKKAMCKHEETRRKLFDLDLIAVAKATLGQGPSEISKYIKSNLGNECNEYVSKEEFNEVFVSVSSLHVKMMQDCRDLFNASSAAAPPTTPFPNAPSAIKESEIPLCLPAASSSSKRATAPQLQPVTRRPEHKGSSDPWFVAEVRTIMDMPGVSVEIFNRSLCDIFSRKPPAYKFTKKDLSLANDLKQLTGFNLTESMFLFALKKILSELDE